MSTVRRRVFLAGNLPKTTRVLRVRDIQNAGLPIHICLNLLEAATLEELNDCITDFRAEIARRQDNS